MQPPPITQLRESATLRADSPVQVEDENVPVVEGTVVEGEDIVYAIEKTKTGPGDKPVDPVVVSTIEITED